MILVKPSYRKTSKPHKDPLPQESSPADTLEALSKQLRCLAFLRIWHILGDKKANPPVEPLLPISRSAFYAGISTGIYPAPVKIGRGSFWRSEDIFALLERLSSDVKHGGSTYTLGASNEIDLL